MSDDDLIILYVLENAANDAGMGISTYGPELLRSVRLRYAQRIIPPTERPAVSEQENADSPEIAAMKRRQRIVNDPMFDCGIQQQIQQSPTPDRGILEEVALELDQWAGRLSQGSSRDALSRLAARLRTILT